jgi:hypothetical protein
VKPLSLALVTDLHFGPDTRFRGKLYKLSHRAPELLRAFVDAMNTEVHPAAIVNLGDDVEDVDHATDLDNYRRCHQLLHGFSGEVVHVAGNHDVVHLAPAELNAIWGREGPLFHARDVGGWHLVVLHTEQRADKSCGIARAQLEWLRADLAKSDAPTVVLMHHSASEQDVGDSRWFSGVPHMALLEERAELRRILEVSGRVRAVFNGHLHRNHLDMIRGIPYVTVQSLVENVDDDAPGRATGSYAIAYLSRERILVRVRGNEPARYQIELDA